MKPYPGIIQTSLISIHTPPFHVPETPCTTKTYKEKKENMAKEINFKNRQERGEEMEGRGKQPNPSAITLMRLMQVVEGS